MTDSQLHDALVAALLTIAPEADPAAIAPDVPLRDQLDIDSFDFLNFILELNRSLGVEVPESDYRELVTLGRGVRYLAGRLAPGAPPA